LTAVLIAIGAVARNAESGASQCTYLPIILANDMHNVHPVRWLREHGSQASLRPLVLPSNAGGCFGLGSSFSQWIFVIAAGRRF
jgi:hypothetical protein